MTQFASGQNALGICDVCGFRFKLRDLTSTVVKGKKTNIKACRSCWDADHPQLKLGSKPVYDPQALRAPRSDTTQREVARDIQWGWNPVGGARVFDTLTPNALVATGHIGTVVVSTEE